MAWPARVKRVFTEPVSPRQNGYIESFNRKLKDELFNGEICDTILEVRAIIEKWRRQYNTIKPHSSFGYSPTTPDVRYPLCLPIVVRTTNAEDYETAQKDKRPH
jgi:putative transposase